MKALALALLVTLSIATLASGPASAEPEFGTRGWFNSRLNGG